MTADTQRLVRIADRMYQIRDLMRGLHRDRYREVLKPWIELIEAVMREKQIEATAVLPLFDRELKAAGKEFSPAEVMLATAATVEIVEPSA